MDETLLLNPLSSAEVIPNTTQLGGLSLGVSDASATCAMRAFPLYPIFSPLIRSHRMSDPTEPNQAEPHPASSHRTPREIAKDEAGPIGGTPNHPHTSLPAENGPVRPLDKSLEQPATDGRERIL